MNSDEIVEALRPYGRVLVHQAEDDGTFSATLYLFVEGMTARVHSGYYHATMRDALTKLQSSTHAAVGQLQPVLEGDAR